MHSQGRNRETWQSYKRRGQAAEGRGSRGGQAWTDNERRRAHADAFTYPDGGSGFYVIKTEAQILFFCVTVVPSLNRGSTLYFAVKQ